MNKEQLDSIISILKDINTTINDNHNDGGFESAKTSGYIQLNKKINSLIKKVSK